MQSRIRTLLLAFGLDLVFGDPPNAFHPVAWMGNLVASAMRVRPRRNASNELVFGAGVVLAGSFLVTGVGKMIESGLTMLRNSTGGTLAGWLVEAALLKSTFSLRGLNCAAKETQEALERGDIPSARASLSRHLVSRDTSTLDESQISAAVIESIAENTSDGILSPLLYYFAGGLPLALAYRFVNTADSMLGYHTPDMEWLGKAPARLDDLMNTLPSRLTGAITVFSTLFTGGSLRRSWRIMLRDARKTQSPNAGYPMSAMAGALGVELEKVGHYRLGFGGRKPGIADIRRARITMFITTAIAVGLVCLLPFWSMAKSGGSKR